MSLASTHHSGVLGRRGFSLVELLIIVLMIATLVAIAVPIYARALDQARMAHAIAEIHTLFKEIFLYDTRHGKLPDTLADIGRAQLRDPWGHPYQYLNFANASGKGQMRKDHFLVPLNSRYDLYSMGPDGDSKPPLSAKASQDDIIFANDGGFVGPASEY
jgi:general secretion pathway protein G